MRQIDNMTSQEIETLHLKGMLAEKTHWEPLLGEVTDAQCEEATEAYYRDDLRDAGRNDDGSGESIAERNQ